MLFQEEFKQPFINYDVIFHDSRDIKRTIAIIRNEYSLQMRLLAGIVEAAFPVSQTLISDIYSYANNVAINIL